LLSVLVEVEEVAVFLAQPIIFTLAAVVVLVAIHGVILLPRRSAHRRRLLLEEVAELVVARVQERRGPIVVLVRFA
jgi:hypothetical protein